jgi:hypothetical protein
MLKVIRILLGVFLIFGAVIIGGCGSDDDTTSSVGTGTYIHIPFPEGTYFARVRAIEVTVTGSGITTPVTAKDTTIVGTTRTEISLPVPAGTARHFDIIASDSLGQNLYRAQMDADVGSGRTDLSALLYPVGYGTPAKVKVFRDEAPWGYYSTDSVLIHAGFTEGSGTNQYQILASALMGSVTLTPGTDLVIIEGAQDSAFYGNYLNARESFESFVEQGGQLFFIACLYSGVEDVITLIFPDSVLYGTINTDNNYTVIDDHPINVGQAETLLGSSAAHGYLWNLSAGSLILNTNSNDSAVTVIYGFGEGTVILSTQTLEFCRANRTTYPTMAAILSRTIRFLLGLDPTPEPLPRTGSPIFENISSDIN